MNCTRNGIRRSTIITVDTNVVIIALYAFVRLEIDELWIEFGNGSQRKWIPIHEVAELHKDKRDAILFWYAFTGCNTVSQFNPEIISNNPLRTIEL